MSLYRIFRCSFQPLILHRSELFVFRNNLKNKFIPALYNNHVLSFSHKVGDYQETVYVGPLSKQIRSIKLFTIITSMSGLFAQPVIYERAQQLETSAPLLIGLFTFVGFFTFVTPLLIHSVTKKYVMEVKYDKKNDSYSATVFTFLLQPKEIIFKPGEPIVPDILGMFTSMTVRGIPLFIDAKFFSDINHYKRIMGYDKPIDLRVTPSDKSSVS